MLAEEQVVSAAPSRVITRANLTRAALRWLVVAAPLALCAVAASGRWRVGGLLAVGAIPLIPAALVERWAALRSSSRRGDVAVSLAVFALGWIGFVVLVAQLEYLGALAGGRGLRRGVQGAVHWLLVPDLWRIGSLLALPLALATLMRLQQRRDGHWDEALVLLGGLGICGSLVLGGWVLAAAVGGLFGSLFLFGLYRLVDVVVDRWEARRG